MHDVVIVGAGPVGGALALALADADLDIVALDARAAGTPLRADRSLALSHGARLIFERLGVWPRLAVISGAITPIVTIDISQAGGFGVTRLVAEEQGLPALGYVVSYRALQSAIDEALSRTRVDVRFGVTVASVAGTAVEASTALSGESPAELRSRLAVVADGSGTAVSGIARHQRDYGQVALIAKMSMERPHGGVAFERFTPDGPMALLPEGDHYGLVWTMTPAAAERVLALYNIADGKPPTKNGVFLERLLRDKHKKQVRLSMTCFSVVSGRFDGDIVWYRRRSFSPAFSSKRPQESQIATGVDRVEKGEKKRKIRRSKQLDVGSLLGEFA